MGNLQKCNHSHLAWKMFVSDQVLRSDALKICQVLCWLAIQRLQEEVEVFITSYILQIHDIPGVLGPAELPRQEDLLSGSAHIATWCWLQAKP